MQRSELLMNIGSFMIVPTRGPRETVSGQTGLTGLPDRSDRSNPEQCNKAQEMRNEVKMLYEIYSHS